MRILVTLTLIATAHLAEAKSVEGSWAATSTTAQSITGDITLSPARLIMAGGVSLNLALTSKNSNFMTFVGRENVSIFSVLPPKNAILLGGNKLCNAPAKWVVAWSMPNDQLGIAIFSDDMKPQSEATLGECGDFFYTRKLSINRPQS